MAKWSKGNARDCWLSLANAWVQFVAGACQKITSDLGLEGCFHHTLWFPLNIAEKGKIIKILNPKAL